jgi:CDP-paratose synthetase
MKKPTILLTGATGFLGSHLLHSLVNNNYLVVILKRSSSNNWRISNLEGQYQYYDVDLQSIDLVFEEQSIDCVIHTACNYGRNGESNRQIIEDNLLFGLRILEAAVKFNTKTFINTDTILQKHLNAYTLSKKHFLDWLIHYSDFIQVINLKIEHMYGPKDDSSKFAHWIITQFQNNAAEIKLTQGEQERDFIYIDDVVSAFIILLQNAQKLSKFNEYEVGTGDLISIKTFVTQLKDSYQIIFGKISTQLAFGSIPYRKDEVMKTYVNNKALCNLGWTIKTNLSEGIKVMLKDIQ